MNTCRGEKKEDRKENNKEKMDKLNRVGEKHITNEGYEIEIIKYVNSNNCTIMFENGVIVENIQYSRVLIGTISNPYHLSVLGVGYFGVGKYVSKINGKKTPEYYKWINILKRCYCDKESLKYPTYKEVNVCEEWKCFQNFAKWVEENYKPEVMHKWHLDKDILCKECKIYSPETCAFVPQEINKLFTLSEKTRGALPIGVVKVNKKFQAQVSNGTGKQIRSKVYETIEDAFQAYKIAKEAYIKEVADKWKDKIDPRVYEAMYNYRVEITD